MVSALVVLVVAASAVDDSVGASMEQPEPVGPVRFHGEVSFLGSAGISGVPSLGVGPGVHLEAGLVLGGSSVVSARASFATVGIFTVMQFGGSYAHLIGDRFTLGIGVTWGALAGCCDAASTASVQTPIRLTVRVGDTARRGLTFGFDVAPGIAYAGGGYRIRPTLPTASIMTGLTVGYAVW